MGNDSPLAMKKHELEDSDVHRPKRRKRDKTNPLPNEFPDPPPLKHSPSRGFNYSKVYLNVPHATDLPEGGKFTFCLNPSFRDSLAAYLTQILRVEHWIHPDLNDDARNALIVKTMLRLEEEFLKTIQGYRPHVVDNVGNVETPNKTKMHFYSTDGVLSIYTDKPIDKTKNTAAIKALDPNKKKEIESKLAAPPENTKKSQYFKLTKKRIKQKDQQRRGQPKLPRKPTQEAAMTKQKKGGCSANELVRAYKDEIEVYCAATKTTFDPMHSMVYAHLIAHCFGGNALQHENNLSIATTQANTHHQGVEDLVMRMVRKTEFDIHIDANATHIPNTHIGLELGYQLSVHTACYGILELPFAFNLQEVVFPLKVAGAVLLKMTRDLLMKPKELLPQTPERKKIGFTRTLSYITDHPDEDKKGVEESFQDIANTPEKDKKEITSEYAITTLKPKALLFEDEDKGTVDKEEVKTVEPLTYCIPGPTPGQAAPLPLDGLVNKVQVLCPEEASSTKNCYFV